MKSLCKSKSNHDKQALVSRDTVTVAGGNITLPYGGIQFDIIRFKQRFFEEWM
jgi:hypothetical protein